MVPQHSVTAGTVITIDMGKPIIAYPNQGGVIIEGDHFELLGGAFVVDVNDLNDLYKTYDYLRYEI